MGRVDQLDCGTQRLSEQQSPQVSFLFHGSQIVETSIGVDHTLQTKKQKDCFSQLQEQERNSLERRTHLGKHEAPQGHKVSLLLSDKEEPNRNWNSLFLGLTCSTSELPIAWDKRNLGWGLGIAFPFWPQWAPSTLESEGTCPSHYGGFPEGLLGRGKLLSTA